MHAPVFAQDRDVPNQPGCGSAKPKPKHLTAQRLADLPRADSRARADRLALLMPRQACALSHGSVHRHDGRGEERSKTKGAKDVEHDFASTAEPVNSA